MREVELTDSDRTIFAICPVCNRTGKGTKAPNFFSMAYTKRQWRRGPVCDNCESPMQFKYEVKTDE